MLSFRKATIDDAELYYEWVNEEEVRKQSFHSERVDFESHLNWFQNKIKDENCLMFLFQDGTEYVGQVRLQKLDKQSAIIGLSVANQHRGKGYASKILRLASNEFLLQNPSFSILAYIKRENLASKTAFEKAGYFFDRTITFQGVESYLYLKTRNE